MSIAAIIFGLLLWRSVPPLFEGVLTEKSYQWFEIACRFAGWAVIAGGIIYGFLK